MILIKASASGQGHPLRQKEITIMPADAVPYVTAIVAFFATFIVAIGGASLWVSMPTPKSRTRQARQRHRFSSQAAVQVTRLHRGT